MYKCVVHNHTSLVPGQCPICFTETGNEIDLVEIVADTHAVIMQQVDGKVVEQLTKEGHALAELITSTDEQILTEVLSKISLTARMKMKYLLEKVSANEHTIP